jgi:hypothetical protein
MLRKVAILLASALSLPASVAAPPPDACALLTKAILTRVSPETAQRLADALAFPPEAGQVGTRGSTCDYGGVYLQIDPFAAPSRVEKEFARSGSARVAGLGDAAFYRDNRGRHGELYVRAGSRTLTIQMSIPPGRTAASIQPNAVELARLLLAELGR